MQTEKHLGGLQEISHQSGSSRPAASTKREGLTLCKETTLDDVLKVIAVVLYRVRTRPSDTSLENDRIQITREVPHWPTTPIIRRDRPV